MDYTIEPRPLKNLFERGAVAYVGLVELKVVAPRVRLYVAALNFGVVEVVEVIDDVYAPRALRQQTPDQVRPDEVRPARYQTLSDSHSRTEDCRPSTEFEKRAPTQYSVLSPQSFPFPFSA